MFGQFVKRAFVQRVSAAARSRTGRSLVLTSGLVFAGTGVALAHSGPDKIRPSDLQSGVVQLTDRDFSPPTPETLAEERAAAQPEGQSAYNPVTGEINWDCPCLGGMAHGPCGPEFKEAFACFIYSTEEIKGSECIPKFSAMQNCFRQYPEVYADFQEDTDTVAAAGARDDVSQKASELKESAKDLKAAAVARGAELEDAAVARGAELKDAAVARGAEIKDAAATKSSEYQDAVAEKTRELQQAAEKKYSEAKSSVESQKDTARASLNDIKKTAVARKDDAIARLSDAEKSVVTSASDVKTAAGNLATDLRDTVDAKTSTTRQTLGQSLDNASRVLDDAQARAAEATSHAHEIAASAASDLAAKATKSGQALSDRASEYASWAQQAAREVVNEAGNKADQLNEADLSELIEKKLHEAHKDASELFANTTSQHAQNAATFASDAVQGIAAEAKEAVNYVAKGVNETFGKGN